MKADNVRNMDNINAEMEYITLATTGIYTNIQSDQSAHYAGSNEYQCQENNCSQNHVDNSNGQFGYCNYSAFPNCCSCCCGYDSKGNNNNNNNCESVGLATSRTAQNTQNYGQIEYQFEYANQSNNRSAGGMESYAMNALPSAMTYQVNNEYNNVGSFPSGLQQEAPMNYFKNPSLDHMGMNMNQMNTEYHENYWNYSNDSNDALQSQTVYSSDFQPLHEKGNNFNHFPNNRFLNKQMFGDMFQSNHGQSMSPGCDYHFCDPIYEMGDNQHVGSFPISNANYTQMCNS